MVHEEDGVEHTNQRWTVVKLSVAALFLASASVTQWNRNGDHRQVAEEQHNHHHRRLEVVNNEAPSYMSGLFDDLKARKKLFADTPEQEIKYWFEYSGPLQKYFYRFSKSRGKADYFEGRDDSGVVSSRFVEEPGGTQEFRDFYRSEKGTRFLDNCWAMGAPTRPATNDRAWREWYPNGDRCRVLLAINTAGAGRGTTMLWETSPPQPHAELPQPWTSEQENAVTHLERNLQEINAMCETGLVAARVQVLVCEPIPARWTEWMDSQLPACGGKAFDPNAQSVEDRPSPIQIVVTASPSTADSCHNLKSGFMEKRAQDLLLAPPFLEGGAEDEGGAKKTNPDLVSSEDHDVYISLKWSTMVTMRSLHSFLQASADIAAGASSASVPLGPTSPFLIPSFVRVSYVSEENSKVAKWRMHGDFFHPAAWEICNDSFDVTWIPSSLSGAGGVQPICTKAEQTARKLQSSEDCGQWWIYFTELQMPTSPDVYASEATPAPVQGGSSFFWMMTDRQRREVVKSLTCRHNKSASCTELPQAVIPLGDLESFLINFTPNTALGKQHVTARRPGYSNEEERKKDRQRVKERKQLNEQEDIEKALFDYTIYPAALFHKDATLKASRAVDAKLSGETDKVGPQMVKSSYYDVTITKPRPPVLGWCQAAARNGLCTLYADYFRMGADKRCDEACGLSKGWTKVEK